MGIALLLGLVEGLTEFLPVSSTGHLVLLSRWLGHVTEADKTLDVVIQAGAVLAAAIYFRQRIAALVRGLARRDEASLRLLVRLGVAFVPVVPAGLLVGKLVKERLFGPVPVAGALVVGGLVMIAVERWQTRRRRAHPEAAPARSEAAGAERDELAGLTLTHAALIGLAQCLSLWPGASRAMVTIVAGRACGLSTRAAAEFSFLLAIPTLGAATSYDFAKHAHDIFAAPGGTTSLVVGLVTAFAVAWLVIAAFLRYVGRLGLVPFALYRIVLGALVLLLA
ncbi:MAG: undecaprenyl-diphosphate phosphatase [Polyangiaceae bacterium]|nr:undecaprenyl-diphosphate phosphatase [Polyangiaceae bacterium]